MDRIIHGQVAPTIFWGEKIRSSWQIFSMTLRSATENSFMSRSDLRKWRPFEKQHNRAGHGGRLDFWKGWAMNSTGWSFPEKEGDRRRPINRCDPFSHLFSQIDILDQILIRDGKAMNSFCKGCICIGICVLLSGAHCSIGRTPLKHLDHTYTQTTAGIFSRILPITTVIPTTTHRISPDREKLC
jgi:hypothetical protein